jgi:hypothetical protein
MNEMYEILPFLSQHPDLTRQGAVNPRVTRLHGNIKAESIM